MTGIDRQRERRWRHLANWLWLAPMIWWMLGGIYYAVTKDSATVMSLIFVPWWILLAGILSYVLMLLNTRWGVVPLLTLLAIGGMIGVTCWSFAGIHSGLTCGLMASLLVGGGLLRIPPADGNSLAVRSLAAVLGVIELPLVIIAAIAITLLVIHLSWMRLPAAWLWWVLAPGTLLILGCSMWARRSWSRKGSDCPKVPGTEAAI